jgi:hypothetical protein
MSGRDRGVRITLVVSNLIKLGGLILAYKAAFVSAHPSPVVLALAGFMMAGAQFSEKTILGLAGHFFAFDVRQGEDTAPTADDEDPPAARR